MVELAELKVFVAAAEEGSFSQAAKRLDYSQSAVSQRIKALEQTFGVALFLRRGRSVHLTEAGQMLLPLARDVLNAAHLLEDAMNNLEGQVVGELVIGCSTTSGKYLLPGLAAAFRQEYPAVRVRVNIFSREEVIARLLDERLALGVVSKRVEHRDLVYQPFFDDHVILIVPADHPWGTYGYALPTDLPDQPLILRGPTAGTTEVLLDGLARHGISPDMLNVVMELESAEAIEMAVEEGIGMAFVSELVAARGLALGRVKQVNVNGLDLRRTIYMARNAHSTLTRAQDRFWAFVQERRSALAAHLRNQITYIQGAQTAESSVRVVLGMKS